MIQDIRLNDGQRKAVEWDEGPLLVLAGPGSGKTLVLTRRVARLVEDSPKGRFGILGLTFTTQAADQMRSRVAKMLGNKRRRTHLTTFHSFAAGVLRQHGSHLGLRPNFSLLSGADRVSALSRVLQRPGFEGLPTGDDGVRRILRTIDYLYREGYDWEDTCPAPLRGAAKEWAVPVYAAYVKSLVQRNYLDYGGMLVCCVQLFRKHPRIADFYRNVYRFTCVDEYQDTNRAQDLILQAIYPGPASNLFVVADDDQTIFQWNGADPRRIWELRDRYQMKVVQLPESFRCPQRVVDVANNLIRHGSHVRQGPQRMVVREPLAASARRVADGAVVVKRFESHHDEVRWVAQNIAERSGSPSDCVVLARNKKLVESAGDALKSAGLMPYLGTRKDDFSSPLVGLAYSALKLANAPNNSDQLARLCDAFASLTGQQVRAADAEAESGPEGRSPLRGFVEAAATEIGDSGQALLRLVRRHLLDGLDYQAFVDAVFQWQPSPGDSFNRIADKDEEADKDDEREEKEMWIRIERQARARVGSVPTLTQLLQEFDLRSKTSPPTDGQTPCLTIHGAKGMEFKHVYVIGLAEGELPSYHAIRLKSGSEAALRAIDEERRSCFVAITRARSSVTLTYAGSYFGWHREPSRFLGEMGLASWHRSGAG